MLIMCDHCGLQAEVEDKGLDNLEVRDHDRVYLECPFVKKKHEVVRKFLTVEPLAKFIERGEFSLCSRGGAAGAQAGAGLSCVTRSI